MATLYDSLGLTPGATPELIEAAKDVLVKRLQARIDRGEASAKAEALLVQDAYNILSNPSRRAEYDARTFAHGGAAAEPSFAAPYRPATFSASPTTNENASVWKLAVIAALLIGLGFVGHRFYATAAVDKVRAEGAVGNDSTRAATERSFLDRLMGNQSKAIDHSAQIANKSLDNKDAAARRQLELEQARLNLQREQMYRNDASRALQAQAQAEREEKQRIDRERRYYTCLNAALERTTGAQAQAQCAGYR